MNKRVIFLLFALTLMAGAATTVAQTYDGYTLYSKMGNNNVYLLDMSKANYHIWSTSKPTGYTVYLLPNQHIMRSVQNTGNQLSGPGMCGMVQEIDWSGTVVWQYTYSTATYCTHHDIHPMPNGNVLVIAYEIKTAAEVTQAGGAQSMIMWPDKIVEIQPSGSTGGNIVWEWHAWDHLVQDHDAAKSNYGVVASHPELLNINYQQQKEWMHVNGIDYNAALDQIVISSHYLNEIYVIDHSTTTAQAASHAGGNSGKGGDILYRWGNPAAYNTGTTSNQVFHVVHDAHWVPADAPMANDLVGFNNQGINNSSSCIDIIAPPYNGYNYSLTAGSAYAPSTYTWRHPCLGNSADQSNSQQFPNGNMLVCIAATGYIYEINSSQAVVWSTTVGGTTAKAFRYTACYVNGGITAAATATPSSVCAGGTSQLNVTVTGGSTNTYAWSSIPAGFISTLQNPVVTPAASTSYIVNVTSGTCTTADTVMVSLGTQPTVTATATPAQVCPYAATQLNAVASGTGPYTYLWSSLPAGFTSTLQSPIATPGVATTYSVIITSGTCNATNSVPVGILPPPTVTATASPQEICANSTSQLYAVPSGTANYTYYWSSLPAGFTSSLQNPVVSPSTSTLYMVSINADGCQAGDSVTVTVDALPATPAITLAGDSLKSNSATGNQWFLNGNLITGATGQYLQLTVPGSYQVQVTGPAGCISAISASFVYVGIDEAAGAGVLTIYPNPATGIFWISGLATSSFETRIFNTMGQQVSYAKNITTIDLSGMEPGLYYVTVITDHSSWYRKKIILVR